LKLRQKKQPGADDDDDGATLLAPGGVVQGLPGAAGPVRGK
jgi:hypothetical protein